MKPYICTVSGRKVPLIDPEAKDINLTDIAYSLARLARFNGHTIGPRYTVAQHSILVMNTVARLTDDPALKLAALLHDAHEAYLGDISAPVKLILGPQIRWAMEEFDAAIEQHFRLPVGILANKIIRNADLEVLAAEKHFLMPQASEDKWECLDGIKYGHVGNPVLLAVFNSEVTARNFMSLALNLASQL